MRTGWMSSLRWLFVGPLIFGVAGGGLTHPTLSKAGASAATQTVAAEDLQATVEALQTEVADLEEENRDLRSQVRILARRTTPTPSSGTSNGTDDAFEIGDAIEVPNQFTITVTGVELVPSIETSFSSDVARGVYVVVDLTLINQQNEPTTFPFRDLYIRDGSKRYGLDDSTGAFNIATYDLATNLDPLQPGLEYTMAAIFDVPADATGLELTTGEEAFTVDLGI